MREHFCIASKKSMYSENIMNKVLPTILISLLSLSTFNVLAHSEHNKSRFVAPQGKDNSDCTNVLRPCKSIAYAVKQANKGDKVLIAQGQYAITSNEDLFYLKGLVVPVLGGYNRFDHFQSQSPNTNPTVLTGVPVDMAKDLRQRGFTVISDGKTHLNALALNKQLNNFKALSQKQSQQNCVNGKAGSFDCNNVDLLAHIPLTSFSTNPSTANDIWGHIDLNTGKEYAIIGLHNGVAVVDVTEPTTPVEVGTVTGLNSIWRDIKVYQYYDSEMGIWQAYAYITIDNAPDQVTIIDLNNLPYSVSLANKSSVVSTAHNVYISNVDPSFNIALSGLTPTLQLTGTNKNGGAFTNYSLSEPTKLTALSTQARGQGYTHDGASMVITDERKNSVCPNSNNCIVFIDFNEKEMKLWNISDPTKVSLIGTGRYSDVASNNQYVHSGWASEDNQYIFVHDEFDEKDAGINSTVRVFSITDLANPVHIGQWTGSTRAIDHNGFVRGNRYYLSNYERGFSVLDISDPVHPSQVGFFDTYTPSNNAAYNGGWGVYPFLPSGNILVSDIGSGLYILKDNTLNSPQGKISFTKSKVDVIQGNDVTVSVQRSAEQKLAATSVGYEILSASALANEDYTPLTGRLNWGVNDSSNKDITISVIDNNTGGELAESFFVRLYDPKNGTTLTSPSYIKVNIAGAVNTGVLNFVGNDLTIDENQNTATIAVSRTGSATGDISVAYALIAGSAEIGSDVEDNSGILNWADGDSENKIITLTLINDKLDENDETFSITLTSKDNSRIGNKSQLNITISDDDTNTAPTVNLGENIQANTGQTINLSATATDAENDVLTYIWSQTFGDNVSLSATDNANVSFVTPTTAGTLTFSVTVRDSKGLSATDSIDINVIAPTTAKSSGGGSYYYLLLLLVLVFILKPKRHKKRKIM